MQQVKILKPKCLVNLKPISIAGLNTNTVKTGVSKLNRLAMLMLHPMKIFIITPQ